MDKKYFNIYDEKNILLTVGESHDLYNTIRDAITSDVDVKDKVIQMLQKDIIELKNKIYKLEIKYLTDNTRKIRSLGSISGLNYNRFMLNMIQ